MSGFIAMHREAVDHHLFAGDAQRLGAWFWMVAKACWKPTKFNVQGKTITLERGQFCCSIRDLAEAWGMPKSTVERFLTRLKTETMIETHNGTGRLVITICNYDKYQSQRDSSGTVEGTPSGTAAGQQRDIKEQGNKGTREEEPIGSPSPTREPASAVEPVVEDVPAKPKRAKAKREMGVDRPLPDDWEPTLTPKAHEIVARWPPGMFERELFKFRSHAVSKGRLAKDWDAAFRTWIGNADERLNSNGQRNGQASWGGPSFHRPDRRDAISRAIDDQLVQHGMDFGGDAQPPRQAGRVHDGEPGIGRVVRYSPG